MSDPYRAFRPRRGRWVAIATAAACAAAFLLLAVLVPTGGAAGWQTRDRVLLVLFGAAITAFLVRYAMLRALPSHDGIDVRNLIHHRHVTWAEVVSVSGVSGGAPWAVLELSDTEQVSVMAIQRSDGPFAHQEVSRLSALVAYHTRPQGPPEASEASD